MNKYEEAKTLTLKTARAARICDTCGSRIERGTEYFHESLGLLAKPPRLRLSSFCVDCGKAMSGGTD